MKRLLLACLLLLALPVLTTNAYAKDLVREFSGTGNSTTAEFEVESPWLLDWRVNGDFPESMAIEVDLFNAATNEYEGRVLMTKQVGDGVRLFMQGGRYYFKVNSTLVNWTLRVEQLTEEEAKAYKPKTQ